MPLASWYDANNVSPTAPSAETCGGLIGLLAATQGHTGTTIGAFMRATGSISQPNSAFLTTTTKRLHLRIPGATSALDSPNRDV
jgi:hypothetical protein